MGEGSISYKQSVKKIFSNNFLIFVFNFFFKLKKRIKTKLKKNLSELSSLFM